MIIEIDTETLFPDGLSDEAINAINAVLLEIAIQWKNKHYHQLNRYYKGQQIDLFDPREPWNRRKTG